MSYWKVYLKNNDGSIKETINQSDVDYMIDFIKNFGVDISSQKIKSDHIYINSSSKMALMIKLGETEDLKVTT